MTQKKADVVICGAGIAGISTAYHLAVTQGITDVVLVDPRSPLSLTSDKSMEGYRNWWPGPDDSMISLMSHSIDLIETLHREVGGPLALNRLGYLYATANSNLVEKLRYEAIESCSLGAGPLRIHTAEANEVCYVPVTENTPLEQPMGADLILEQGLIRQHFPFLTQRTVAVLHARRCGWFAAHQFGMHMLQQAKEQGVQLLTGEVTDIVLDGDQVTAVKVSSKTGPTRIETRHFVSAAGPYQATIGRMLGLDFPITYEKHIKIVIRDPLSIFDQHTPLVIWEDPIHLAWSAAERSMLAESADTRWLVEEIPAGVHGKPEGKGENGLIVLQWAYDLKKEEPVFPLSVAPDYPEIVLRGMATVVPGLSAYLERLPKPVVDGGYYATTPENRPLIGPLPIEGAYIIGGLGGFGMQVSPAAGELLSTTIAGGELPSYAPAFRLDRYDDPNYQKLLARWGASGQI